MSSVPLRLGRLAGEALVQRSGLRWLKDEGQDCRAGEIIAFCTVALAPTGTSAPGDLFLQEAHDLQVGFLSPAPGRLRRSSRTSRGGFLDLLGATFSWRPEEVIGRLECETRDAPIEAGDGMDLELRLYAGRRATPLAEVRQGVLSGWYDRSRAWPASIDAHAPTLLSLGVCEQLGVIRGEGGGFAELLDAAPAPLHAVYMPENPLVPSARVLLDQRATVDVEAIGRDLGSAWRRLAAQATPRDWMFVGALLGGLQGRPLDETYPLMSRESLFLSGPATAVLLSLHAEPVTLLRHKALGYHVHVHDHRIYEAGAATRAWLRGAFEPVRRTPQMIKDDLAALTIGLRSEGRRVLVMNMMSTSGFEDVFNYTPFDAPIGDILGSFRAKELNLVLHDLARETGLKIIDCDALAADFGGAAHLADGVHQSGPLQAAVRREVLRAVHEGQHDRAGSTVR